MRNYWGQLLDSYPEKAEILEWMKYALDNRVYYYGSHFKAPFEARPWKVRMISRMASLYHRFKTVNVSYDGSVISNAYFNVADYIKKEGYNVLPPPWQTDIISKKTKETLYQMICADFNFVLNDEFQKSIYQLRDELKLFFHRYHIPFLLLSNDLVPIHRIAIDVCKELGIPTGIFLHGLPGRYNDIDDSRADYLFVWGEKIKENYINAGSKTNVVVVGHPNFSNNCNKIVEPRDVVVISRAAVGAPSNSAKHIIDDRGLCIQHIYAVETALKKAGINHALLRLHPSESAEWYSKFMDSSFYTIDKKSLSDTISQAKMFVGHISTVLLDAVLNNIPCYPFVIDSLANPYACDIVSPFCNRPDFPTAFSAKELTENIQLGNSVTRAHFDGYINPVFDIKKITNLIQK